jgi:hypothetical protein
MSMKEEYEKSCALIPGSWIRIWIQEDRAIEDVVNLVKETVAGFIRSCCK